MNWLNKLERKFGKYAVPNLIVWVLGAYGIGFILDMMYPQAVQMLNFQPHLIFRGQVWRLVTWIFQPTGTSLFFIFFMMMMYYHLGSALERAWGVFRFNLYLLGGMLFTVVGCLSFYGIVYAIKGEAMAYVTSTFMSQFVSTNYINMSIFLAFAMIYPNMEVLLMFILPVKMKWMSIFYGVVMVYDIINNARAYGYAYGTDVGIWVAIILVVVNAMALINFLIFFFSSRTVRRYSPKEVKRRQDFRRQMAEPRPGSGITRHKCAVCGRTEVSNPELEFRYCSKCEGNFEYCQDHLFTHQHVHRS